MLKTKKVLSICLLIVILFSTISYAKSVKVTSENLKSAFNNLGNNATAYGINVSDTNINITMKLDNSSYDMKYDLTNKPTFIYEAIINKGMTYDEFETRTNCSYAHMLAFTAVAEVQGVDVTKAMSYYMSSMLNGEYNLTSSKYMIINPAEGVEVNTNGDSNIILESEFGNRVMEYVNDVYKDKYTKTDNTYTYTIERKDVNESSCKIIYTLEINVDDVYDQLNENKVLEDNNNNDDSNKDNDKDNTLNKLPQTGTDKFILTIAIFSVILIVILSRLKLNKYRDI